MPDAGLATRDRALLGVRRRWTADGDRSRSNQAVDEARFFVTERGIENMLANLDDYVDWRTGRRPRNFFLFESADGFHGSTVEEYWTDDEAKLPTATASAEWEIWTRRSLEGAFVAAADDIGVDFEGGVTRFVDVDVRTLIGTRSDVERLIEESAAVVELRGASSFVSPEETAVLRDRVAGVEEAAARVRPARRGAPVVTLLDTGVNRRNPLLRQSLPASRCHAARPEWDVNDADGHGTKMAGVALYGDLDDVLNGIEETELEIALESVVVSAPRDPRRLPAREALAAAIELVERTSLPRVFCLAATAVGEAEDGRPTSTSATLDALAYADGTATRLVCTAVGNVQTSAIRPYRVSHYATHNVDHGVQSPAQALNALSVGAATNKCSTANLLAPPGGLAPTSRTTQAWQVSHPRKPDIVMEGGNHFIDVGGRTSIPHVPDMVRTTSRDLARLVTVTGETSAATAAAARLACRARARYPSMRAETIRALMVNSARWTEEMERLLVFHVGRGLSEAKAAGQVLKCFGWGIPDEERLFWSADDALTMVVEDTLRPFMLTGTYVRMGQMKSFRLPWPDQALEALGATPIEMRCTLSYFIEPDPGEFTAGRRELYASHRLKFDLKRHGETDDQALARFNNDVEAEPGGAGEIGWLLGSRLRTRGSLQQDVWKGRAYQLRDRNLLMVAPNRGWWARRARGKYDRDVHFSLVVTITSPEVQTSLYTEVLTQVEADVPLAAAIVTA
ncbi:S8 family peptidase [Roseomonas xinghualingensis]|uniref:S8 family peptidase n=1 Tax=Roseomonas xinghualingensis TaxID=2986475 RepID=UPI0021F0B338|nr:S8 family peptidase [Roseomonas sp. SXEYE001]MCV4208208.1 S8 family peptidase [Roseomonas sp. SXEYE001]